ncbi:hypothetical protein RB195_010980 [Necator americanus]|uniref:Uncharacterized protein n=1 Tax=Necator americanus TaxID=51031 RepID=A0ABR1D0B6_NECAM
MISCVGGPTDRISWFLNRIVLRGVLGTISEVGEERGRIDGICMTYFDELELESTGKTQRVRDLSPYLHWKYFCCIRLGPATKCRCTEFVPAK